LFAITCALKREDVDMKRSAVPMKDRDEASRVVQQVQPITESHADNMALWYSSLRDSWL